MNLRDMLTDDATMSVGSAVEDERDDASPATGKIEALRRLDKDLKKAAVDLKPGEVRYLVSLYYEMQEQRIRASAQIRASQTQEEPNALISWMLANYETLENDIKRAMDAYSLSTTEGQWLRSVVGIGPVLAAGFLAHIDIARTPSPSHLWSLAGLNPTAVWEKKTKRPWNAQLKVLCWKAGQSFVKTSGNANSFYGPIYAARKVIEQTRNEAGAFADQARAKLATTNIGKDTIAYTWYAQGKLPPAHIQQRAERYAVKMFLAHLHTVLHELRMPAPHPQPWAIAHGGHVDYIPPPNWPMPAKA